MPRRPLPLHQLEILEARIAPAAVIDGTFKIGQVGTRIELQEGEGLSTGGDQGGSYLLFVEKGRALVFTTDLNNNGALDYNEITGIAAGDGLRLISFVDIHGDIVTNLKSNGFLTDSDNNSANDPPSLAGDGRTLLSSTIEKIELRSLTTADIRDVNGDGIVDELDLKTRFALSSYSIHGNIYAGGGFGASDGGLLIDSSGLELQAFFYSGTTGRDLFVAGIQPTVGSIKVGTSGSNDYFSFGSTQENDIQGFLLPFVPAAGVAGGSITNVRAADINMTFNIASLEAGNGGLGAKGGDILGIRLNGDDAGGYLVIAGDGGNGPSGGAGGSIVAFTDLGSATSLVVLNSGDGGQGLTGVGGAGGDITFGTFNVSGNVNVLLGNGGSGFSSGGNGASFENGVLIGPDGDADPVPVHLVATYHDRAVNAIGTHLPIDFNGDGFNDYVFTSSNPGQLVVSFGNGRGGFGLNPPDENNIARLNRIYLDGFANSEALTVGDFNGDSRLDIATASTSEASFSGIRVFLAEYEDRDSNGSKETFVGFSRGINSPLPSLATIGTSIGVVSLNRFRSANAVTDMAAGDFDGNGVTDIAVTAAYYDATDLTAGQVLIFLKGDVEDNGGPTPTGTGQFYADFGAKATPTTPATFFAPFIYISDDQTKAVIEATTLRTNLAEPFSDHDVIIGGISEANPIGKRLFIFDNFSGNVTGINGQLSPTAISLGSVDTNRGTDVAPQDVIFRDFTILDYNEDGNADIVSLSSSPSAFLVALKGVYTPSTPQDPANYTFAIASGTGNNAGIRLGQGDSGFNIGENFFAIKSTDADGDGKIKEIAVLNYPAGPAFVVNQIAISAADGPQNATLAGSFTSGFSDDGRDDSIVAFDTYYLTKFVPGTPSSPPQTALVGYGVGLPVPEFFNEFIGDSGLRGNPPLLSAILAFNPLNEFSLNLIAGDGGSSAAGKAGTGGFIGGTPTKPGTLEEDPVTGLVGNVSITFPTLRAQATVGNIVAGDGGNGFTKGGSGGSVSGVSTKSPGSVRDESIFIFAGDGGFGVSGAGGSGGSIFNNSLQRAISLTAGDGGSGVVGGNGGSILGNKKPGAFDAETGELTLTAGSGGVGTKRGGNGGLIRDFVTVFTEIFDGGVSGPFLMFAGDGGTSVSGKGGNGGSVINSSPRSDVNALADEIYIRAGNGGNGIAGGTGGSVATFVNQPTITDTPTIVTVLAGDGGAGSRGKGGKGGDISNIKTPSSAQGDSFDSYSFNRIIAGEGGASAGNAGGNGGRISNLDIGASAGAIAVVGGAGGSGLARGGNGGSVVNSQVASGGPDTGGKVLVVAGAGGDAFGFKPNPNDPASGAAGGKAFGGVIGRGGNGGSIINFSQANSIDVSVDLIAGNGGSTPNYGTTRDTKSFVGKGGSIAGLDISGSIGNVAADRKIKAYNDDNGDGTNDSTLAEWVNTFLKASSGATNALNDNIGNVGIVVGAAGRVKAVGVLNTDGTPRLDATGAQIFVTQPASNANKLAGTLSNVKARLLMSAVAGDVNQIATIRAASNINITGDLVGADKDPTGPTPQYISVSGNTASTPELGGKLVDGAFISSSRVPEINGKPRVFIL